MAILVLIWYVCLHLSAHRNPVALLTLFVEGLLTFIIGLLSFFLLPPGPTQTKTWFRPNGWFTERFVHSSRLTLVTRSHDHASLQRRDNRGQQVSQSRCLRFLLTNFISLEFFVMIHQSQVCTIGRASQSARFARLSPTGDYGLFTSWE